MTSLAIISFLRGGESLWAPPPHGLARVCACLTWFDDDEGSAAPWSFLEALANKLVQALPGPASPHAIFLERKRSSLFSHYREKVVSTEPLSITIARWRGDPATAFPDRMEFRSDKGPGCVVEIEFWNTGGGPSPYHDSVTLSFYGNGLSSDLVLAASQTAAQECGATFREPSP